MACVATPAPAPGPSTCVPVETCIFMCVLTALNTGLVVAYVVVEGFRRAVERWHREIRAAEV